LVEKLHHPKPYEERIKAVKESMRKLDKESQQRFGRFRGGQEQNQLTEEQWATRLQIMDSAIDQEDTLFFKVDSDTEELETAVIEAANAEKKTASSEAFWYNILCLTVISAGLVVGLISALTDYKTDASGI
jgi:hypothetical protein